MFIPCGPGFIPKTSHHQNSGFRGERLLRVLYIKIYIIFLGMKLDKESFKPILRSLFLAYNALIMSI